MSREAFERVVGRIAPRYGEGGARERLSQIAEKHDQRRADSKPAPDNGERAVSRHEIRHPTIEHWLGVDTRPKVGSNGTHDSHVERVYAELRERHP